MDSPAISLFTFLMGLLGIIITVGGAIVTLMVLRKNEVSKTQVQRAEASEALVKLRDTAIDDCNKKCAKCQEELEDVTVELRTQMGLNIGQLMSYWQTREDELAKMNKLEQENRVLRKSIEDDRV